MKLKISTGLYKNELLHQANENGIIFEKTWDRFDVYFALIEKDKQIIQFLLELLMDLILVSNEVVKHSANIKPSLKKIVFASYEKEITADIECFLAENDCINLDGFLNFRLKKYKDMVDMILYAVVKKVLR